MAKRTPKPAPVVTQTICSICGEDWAQHQEVDGEVSTLECVRLLKAQLATRPTITIMPPTIVRPYISAPYVQPYSPWPTQIWCSSLDTFNTNTPTIVTASSAAA